jgi:spore maturation protein CgeB
MKLCRITTVYSMYWQDFYAKNASLLEQSYLQQKSKIDDDGFGWADFWTHALQPLAYEVMEINANIDPLQKAWAKEHGMTKLGKDWMFQIVWAQVRSFQPDVLFIDDYVTFSREWISQMRQDCPSIRLVIGWCGAPYQSLDVFKAYDVVLSCIPELVETFRALGHCSQQLHHAFDPRILDRLSSQAPLVTIPVSFVGQIERGNQKHQAREALLASLVTRVPIQIFTPSANYPWYESFKTLAKQGLYSLNQWLRQAGISENWQERWPGLRQANHWSSFPVHPINPLLKPYMYPPVFGLEMFQTLRNSQVTLNSHIDLSANSASNMRLFEATGVGACLVTDWKKNLSELFEPDHEIVAYHSPEDCIAKIQWLLDHPCDMQNIAKAAQKKILKSHTFEQRAPLLNQIIKDYL